MMKKIRVTTHQAVVRRLLKKPGFHHGYEKELEALWSSTGPLHGKRVGIDRAKFRKLVQAITRYPIMKRCAVYGTNLTVSIRADGRYRGGHYFGTVPIPGRRKSVEPE
jgi:hypothetical protein